MYFVKHYRHSLYWRKFLYYNGKWCFETSFQFQRPTVADGKMAACTFDLEHRAGERHGNANAMS